MVKFKAESEKKVKSLEQRNVYLDKCNKALDERVLDMEQGLKASNGEIVGLEKQENEITTEVAKRIAQKLRLDPNNIEDASRVGRLGLSTSRCSVESGLSKRIGHCCAEVRGESINVCRALYSKGRRMFDHVFGEDSPVLAMLRRRQRCRHRGCLQRQEDCLVVGDEVVIQNV
ncbi:unnamed protein product [Leptidea sinapis]|uniref:Uncharacterized protein n=1 Tax=Leptidea sinapis TaxID=189913 RepID=A0A5E4R827_9NEOP|nr:unnamed protein product [Leptidea sinapis]